MMLGMTPFTLFHVALSLVGIATGFVVLFDLLASRKRDGWSAVFLLTTLATSVTGFFFPFEKFLPSHAVGIVSLLIFAAVFPALYIFRLAGSWRWIYVVGVVFVQYLNVFVLVVQLFLKVPTLHVIAPTQADPPFVIAQAVVLFAFIALGTLAVLRFRPDRAAIGATS